MFFVSVSVFSRYKGPFPCLVHARIEVRPGCSFPNGRAQPTTPMLLLPPLYQELWAHPSERCISSISQPQTRACINTHAFINIPPNPGGPPPSGGWLNPFSPRLCSPSLLCCGSLCFPQRGPTRAPLKRPCWVDPGPCRRHGGGYLGQLVSDWGTRPSLFFGVSISEGLSYHRNSQNGPFFPVSSFPGDRMPPSQDLGSEFAIVIQGLGHTSGFGREVSPTQFFPSAAFVFRTPPPPPGLC